MIPIKPNNNAIGMVAELRLAAKLIKLGWCVNMPLSDTDGYDLIITKKCRNTLRIQVKTASKEKNQRTEIYKAHSCRRGGQGKKIYTKEDADIMAVYLEEKELWYFLPISKICVACINIRPLYKKSKYVKYSENWKIFDELKSERSMPISRMVNHQSS